MFITIVVGILGDGLVAAWPFTASHYRTQRTGSERQGALADWRIHNLRLAFRLHLEWNYHAQPL